MFIAFIGLKGTGVVVDNSATLVTLGNMKNPAVWVGLAGVLIIGVLLVKKVKGAILIGILSSTIIGLIVGVTVIPENFTFVSLPPSIEPIFF